MEKHDPGIHGQMDTFNLVIQHVLMFDVWLLTALDLFTYPFATLPTKIISRQLIADSSIGVTGAGHVFGM